MKITAQHPAAEEYQAAYRATKHAFLLVGQVRRDTEAIKDALEAVETAYTLLGDLAETLENG